jgi:Alpha and gamma adaptin binding protein p34
MSSVVSILRIGPFAFAEEVGSVSRLRLALLKHFRAFHKSGEDSNQERSASREHQFCVTNRYFTAQILLERIEDEAKNPGCFAEDGIVLVFDLSPLSGNVPTTGLISFDTMEAFHSQAEAAGTSGDLLRLCVGVGNCSELLEAMSEKEYEKEYSRRVLWCLDHGYEYVEADLSDEGLKHGLDARDKEGFARIVEAISGTVWSSAIMEKRRQQELKQSYTKDAIAVDNDRNASVDAGSYQPPDPSSLPPLLSDKVADLERERLARDTLLAEENASETAMDQTNLAIDISQQREEARQERSLTALEDSLNQAKRLREHSVAGELTDEERRKRAGDAAVLIMNMMEQMGFDGEESDDDSEILIGDGKEGAINVVS